jgi:hypothetical protein
MVSVAVGLRTMSGSHERPVINTRWIFPAFYRSCWRLRD